MIFQVIGYLEPPVLPPSCPYWISLWLSREANEWLKSGMKLSCSCSFKCALWSPGPCLILDLSLYRLFKAPLLFPLLPPIMVSRDASEYLKIGRSYSIKYELLSPGHCYNTGPFAVLVIQILQFYNIAILAILNYSTFTTYEIPVNDLKWRVLVPLNVCSYLPRACLMLNPAVRQRVEQLGVMALILSIFWDRILSTVRFDYNGGTRITLMDLTANQTWCRDPERWQATDVGKSEFGCTIWYRS